MVYTHLYLFCILLLLSNTISAKKGSKKSKNEGDWIYPSDPKWSSADGMQIRIFYKDHVSINQNDWQVYTKHATFLLEHITGRLKEDAISRPEISFQPIIRQGSSAEGLKVLSCNEFDVVIPFEFPSLKGVKVMTHSEDNDINSGYAEVRVREIPPEFQKDKQYKKLFKEENGKKVLSTKALHDTVFKSIFDKILPKPDKEIESKISGKTVRYRIKRKSNAPSITLETTVIQIDRADSETTKTISIDFIPGFVFSDSKGPRLLVPKWIPESQAVNTNQPFKNSDTVWKISFYEYELKFIEQHKGKFTSDYLITAFKILKGLKKADEKRIRSSQFASVLSTYHMKNVLMFSLMFADTMNNKYEIKSTTEALGCLISMITAAVDKHILPKFFVGNSFLSRSSKDYPEFGDKERMNIFLEASKTALEQALRDLGQALKYHNLENWSLNETPSAFGDAFGRFIDGRLSSHDEL